jgi:acetoin utilization deacetylase AcuC-like enzyme
MNTLLLTHPACLEHETGPHHPERPERLRAILAALETEAFALLDRRMAPRAEKAQLARAHPAWYVDWVLARVPEQGLAAVDGGDTVLSPRSGEAALRAAGAAVAAVDAVLSGEARNAFCAVRPPGHHAEPERAMGFCLFNNVVVAAQHARAAHGLKRIAVVDFDVHHGNGTQAAFEREPELFYASTHQAPLYPGTGAARDRGLGNIVNVPLAPFAGSDEFRAAMSEILLPSLEAFGPELVLISAGFDAHMRDPLASLNLVEGDFAWITRELCALAERRCRGRVVSTLEGGYDLRALAASAAAHVDALLAG